MLIRKASFAEKTCSSLIKSPQKEKEDPLPVKSSDSFPLRENVRALHWRRFTIESFCFLRLGGQKGLPHGLLLNNEVLLFLSPYVPTSPVFSFPCFLIVVVPLVSSPIFPESQSPLPCPLYCSHTLLYLNLVQGTWFVFWLLLPLPVVKKTSWELTI